MIVSSKIQVYSDSQCTQLVATVSGTTAASQTLNVTGLNPNTTYYVVASAIDNNGLEGFSSVANFTTASANYSFVGSVGYSSVYDTLDAEVTATCAGATFTACGIEFATNSQFTGTLISGQYAGPTFDDEITGFAENTTYYYRYFATTTEAGTQYHVPQNNTITTRYDEPTLTITHSNVSDTSAVITLTYNGNYPIDINNMNATVREHGGGGTPIGLELDNMTTGVPEAFTITSLTPNTQYDIEWNVDYYTGEITQNDTFTTYPSRPTVTIGSITNITPSSATIPITIS